MCRIICFVCYCDTKNNTSCTGQVYKVPPELKPFVGTEAIDAFLNVFATYFCPKAITMQ